MRVVGHRAAECIVNEWRSEKWPTGKILERTAPPQIAREVIQLSIGTELHDTAIVIAVLRGIYGGFGVARNWYVIGLPRTQRDDVAVKCSKVPFQMYRSMRLPRNSTSAMLPVSAPVLL